MLNVRTFKLIAASLALSASTLVPAFAQGTTTLRNPLIPGVQRTPAGVPAALGAAPPAGSGPTPVGVTRGMSGPPTLLPWVVNVPTTDIDLGNTHVNLPVTPAVQSPPGTLGPALAGYVPPPPSTPGLDPGMLTVPSASTNTVNSAQQVTVDPNGWLPRTSVSDSF